MIMDEHLAVGKKKVPDRMKKDFFSGMDNLGSPTDMQKLGRRLDIDRVMDASYEVMLQQENEGAFLKQRVNRGETEFN